jgi:hypothetical protein
MGHDNFGVPSQRPNRGVIDLVRDAVAHGEAYTLFTRVCSLKELLLLSDAADTVLNLTNPRVLRVHARLFGVEFRNFQDLRNGHWISVIVTYMISPPL